MSIASRSRRPLLSLVSLTSLSSVYSLKKGSPYQAVSCLLLNGQQRRVSPALLLYGLTGV